jgi:hypothetical protein
VGFCETLHKAEAGSRRQKPATDAASAYDHHSLSVGPAIRFGDAAGPPMHCLQGRLHT